ncbi:MAG: FAD:protein FMN transferase [Acidimicrobiia bacterium]|nr:FAD:protein FMN transferase [Acidimicrobiia bacterium]
MADRGRHEFHALGTGCVVLVTDPARLDAAVAAVHAELDEIDGACSRFRPDSELEMINANAGTTVVASPLLIEAVTVALRAAELTDGDVIPTVGEAMQVLGYDRDFPAVPSDGDAVATVARVPGWQQIDVDRAAQTVRVPHGVRLDLGATAKALAADRAATRAAAVAGCGVLVSLGGDLAVAGSPPGRGWEVRVTDDHAAGPDAEGQTVLVHDGGLATSSTTVRRWARGGEELHHVVDPRTGRPAEEVWRTVSVAAASCVDANIASTAAIIRGEQAPAWLESLGLPARLVLPEGWVVRVGGWPAEEVRAR